MNVRNLKEGDMILYRYCVTEEAHTIREVRENGVLLGKKEYLNSSSFWVDFDDKDLLNSKYIGKAKYNPLSKIPFIGDIIPEYL